ncbi:MAG: hypothetical protein ACFFB3_11355 [Candidatus Hodarchaeota archaeon]
MAERTPDEQYADDLTRDIGVGQRISTRDRLIQLLFEMFYGSVNENQIKRFRKKYLYNDELQKDPSKPAGWLQRFGLKLEKVYEKKLNKAILAHLEGFQEVYWEKSHNLHPQGELITQSDKIPSDQERHHKQQFIEEINEILGLEPGLRGASAAQTIFKQVEEKLLEVLDPSWGASLFKSKVGPKKEEPPFHLELLLLFVFSYAQRQKLWLSRNFIVEVLGRRHERTVVGRIKHFKEEEAGGRDFLQKSENPPHPLPAAYQRLTKQDSTYYRFEHRTTWEPEDISFSVKTLFWSLSSIVCLWLAYQYEIDGQKKNRSPLEFMESLLPHKTETISQNENNINLLKKAQVWEPELLIPMHDAYDEISERELVEKHCQLYQAEELQHRFGYPIKDEDASNKKAWLADLSEFRGHIVYGPYEVLPELGDYVAFFKIKIDNNSSREPLLLLDVTGGGYATRIIRGTDFLEANRYQLFGVKFECRELARMEYRAFNQIQLRGRIWFDYIAIAKLAAELLVPAKQTDPGEKVDTKAKKLF